MRSLHTASTGGLGINVWAVYWGLGLSRLIWTPLKLVPPGTNLSEIIGPPLKNLFPPGTAVPPAKGPKIKSVHVRSWEGAIKDAVAAVAGNRRNGRQNWNGDRE